MSVAESPLTASNWLLNWLTDGTDATCQSLPFHCSMSWLKPRELELFCDPTATASVGDAAYTLLSTPIPNVAPGVTVQVVWPDWLLWASAGVPGISARRAVEVITAAPTSPLNRIKIRL